MLIDGTPVNTTDIEEVTARLNALPSGFAERTTRLTQLDLPDEHEATRKNKAGIDAYYEWKSTRLSRKIDESLENFRQSAALFAEEGNTDAQINAISNYGQVCFFTGRHEDALPDLRKSVAYYTEHDNRDYLIRDMGVLHAALMKLADHKQIFGEREAAKTLLEEAAPIRKTLTKLLAGHKGENINQGAVRVEQGEIGFSADTPIGTDNVNDCICVIIRDPASKKTALAHVDMHTPIDSLQAALDGLPQAGATDLPLEARLIGARFKEPNQHGSHGMERSRENIKKVISFLNKAHVNVLTAALQDEDQPTSIVVDPKSFEIREEIPGDDNPDSDLANAMPLINSWGTKLRVAFDLTRGDEHTPILLKKEHLKAIETRFGGKGIDGIFDWYEKNASYSWAQQATVSELTEMVITAKKASADEIIATLESRVDELRREGTRIDDKDIVKARKAINSHPIHIGQTASTANAPLARFVEEQLFTPTAGGGYKMNIEGLEKLDFAATTDGETLVTKQASFRPQKTNSKTNAATNN